MNDTKEIYEILRGEREPNTKAPAKKTEPAKKATKKLPVARAFINDLGKQYDIILSILLLTDDFEELNNTYTGEVQYKLSFEYSDLFMTSSEFKNMIISNCDTIYNGLLEGGCEKMLLEIDNIQSNSEQLKVVAHKKTAYTYDMIEAYHWQETETEIELKNCNGATAQTIIDILLY